MAIHRSLLLGVIAPLLLLTVWLTAGAVDAATLHVASNGSDNNACGSRSAPCRSINRAIANALDGDRIVVGPGTYGVAAEGSDPLGCLCMIHVNKSVTLVSRDGAGATVLDVGFADLRGVVIEANSVIFGASDKGFTITNSRREALLLGGATTDVKVQGNVAMRNGANGNDAFMIQGAGHTVIGNWARDNARSGFGIAGSDHIVKGNWSSNNLQGVEITASGRFIRNAIVGNTLDGVVVNVAGRVLLIRRNDVLGNGQHGLRIFRFDGIITQNNIYGNATIASNCGLLNQSGGSVNAPENFWGAPSGPGPDPADAVCDDLGSVTLVEPVATKEFNIPDLAEADD
jgi:hypothetical protein